MLSFILRRVGLLIPTFIGITIATFGFIRLLPGDPVLLMAGERGVSPERAAVLMHQFGYDRPLYVQYFDFLTSAISGDLGNSIITKRPVLEEFWTLFPATFELTLIAMLFGILLGIPAGVLAAVRRGTVFDHSGDGHRTHRFFHADILVGPAAHHPLLCDPANGRRSPAGSRSPIPFRRSPVSMLIDSLILRPGRRLQVGVPPSHSSHHRARKPFRWAWIARQTRSAMLEVLGDDYVRTARGQGALHRARGRRIHALRNALIPVITTIGLQWRNTAGRRRS